MSLNQKSVTTEIDDFIRLKDMPYWIATLSDGTKVYEDDDRPELEEKNSWRRLKSYCELNKIYVVKIEFVFRSNRITIDTSDCEGVFFIKSLLGFIRIHKGGGPLPQKRFPTRVYYNIGKLVDGEIITDKFEMPTIILRDSYKREVGETEKLMTIYKNV